MVLYEGVKGVGKPRNTGGRQARRWLPRPRRTPILRSGLARSRVPRERRVYEIKLPENLDGSLDVEHPLLKGLQTWSPRSR